MAALMPQGKQQYFTAGGIPLVGGKVYTYAAGTTTPLATYTDAAAGTPNANPVILDSRGEASIFFSAVNYKIVVKDSLDSTIWTQDNLAGDAAGKLRTDLAASTGSALVGHIASGAGSVATTVQVKLRERVSVKDFGAVGDGVTDDTAAIQAAWDSLTDGSTLTFPPGTAYKITDTLEFFDNGRVTVEFNGQLINASSFTGTARPALHFKGISQSRIGGIFVIGNLTSVSKGVWFDADADSTFIHTVIGKIHVSGCDIGVMFGNDQGYQFSDSTVEDVYGADCNIGVYMTGENTLAMYYQRVAAYANNNYGVIIEQGGGCIGSLQVADSGYDIYFGSPAGTNGNKLNRWDILSGYSEEGVNGEVFIGSTACTDANPFREQIVIKGFRCTPFSSTNVEDFVRWNLNGDLIFRECTFTHGTQLPKVKLDANTTYRSPQIIFDSCVIDCAPTTSAQVPLNYETTTIKQKVQINSQVNNGMTFWQNNGSANEGIIKRGIYTEKLATFTSALLNISGLVGAWDLRDISSATCRNVVLGGDNLTVSATLERRDVWLDDGLVGFFRNATTSKTVSTTSAVYAAASEYTFGAFLRATAASTSEEDRTNIGGIAGMRIALYNGALLCLVGGANAYNGSVNAYDPHLVIGRYISGTSIEVDAINLRTGETYNTVNVAGIPVFGALTWVNGVNFRNDVCVRGFPFVYSRALTDVEVGGLLQTSLLCTSSWRDA